MDRHDVLILDKLCHACLVDAARASGAILRVYPHNALGKLEDHLQWARREHPDARVVVLTEAVFSMDGDRAPLAEIVELKERHGAMLLVDEAHAVGVIGRHGRGLAHELGVTARVDILMGTMSKALGVSGGYLCGRRSLIDLLVNRARTFIYSTAQPPALAAAAEAAVDFLETDEGERRRLALWQNIRLLARQLPPPPRRCGCAGRANAPPKPGGSAIFPWIVGHEADAVDFSARLAKKGFFAPAIRYPTVAKGTARLRLTVTARHRPEQIMDLGRTLRGWRGRCHEVGASDSPDADNSCPATRSNRALRRARSGMHLVLQRVQPAFPYERAQHVQADLFRSRPGRAIQRSRMSAS